MVLSNKFGDALAGLKNAPNKKLLLSNVADLTLLIRPIFDWLKSHFPKNYLKLRARIRGIIALAAKRPRLGVFGQAFYPASGALRR